MLFWQVSTLWQRAVKEALRQYDLTHTQYVILAVIEELQETDDKITQKKISDFSMIDAMTISSTLRLLEKKGFVQRIPQIKDTRANQIINTKAGSLLLKKAISAVESVDKRFFFNNDDDLVSLHNLLGRLKENNMDKTV